MNAPAAEQITPEVEELQVSISMAIGDLGVLASLVAALADTHVRGLGFLSHDALQTQGALVRKERRIRNSNARLGFPEPSGNVPVPGNVAALSLDAEIVFTLHHLARRIVRELRIAGVCTLVRVIAEPDTDELLAYIRQLVFAAPSPTLLGEVLEDLESLSARATTLVDGNDRVLLPADCPHCGRRTLVVYFNDGLIRCDRDPKSGHFHPCVCPDSYCRCKQKPVSFRHGWLRAQTTSSTSWWALSDRLNLNRINGTEQHP